MHRDANNGNNNKIFATYIKSKYLLYCNYKKKREIVNMKVKC